MMTTLPKGTTSATKRRKAVSFTAAAEEQQQQEQQQSPTKARAQQRDRGSTASKEENERKGTSPKKQRRRIQSAEDLPKRDRKKKKKGKGKKKGSFLSETEMQHDSIEDSSPPRPKRSPSPKPERKGKEKEEREAVPPPAHEEEPLSRNDSSNTTWYNTDTDAEMSDSSDFEDEDEDSWESDELETTPQRDTLSPPEQDLRGIVGLVRGKGVKPVLCEVGGQNLNCCNLLLQGSSKLEEPIVEKKGQAKDLVTEGDNIPAAFNILLCPQHNPADVLELAADSNADMQRWLAFFRSLYTNEVGASLIQGFLWLHISSRKMRLSPGSWTGLTNISTLTDLAVETKWQWQRYYCICDSSRFEWFALSYVKVVPLHSVIQVQTSVIEPTRTIKFMARRNSKSAFIGWGDDVEKVLDPRYYRYKVSLIKANSKESFAFLTSSIEDMHAWSKAIVSHQREPETRRSGGGTTSNMPTLIEEKSPRPEKSAGETIVRTKYREFRHWRNVKVMKDDEDNEVLKIRSSCRQFRKKAEKNMASAQWRGQRSKSAGNLRANVNPPASPRLASRDDFQSHPAVSPASPRSPRMRDTSATGSGGTADTTTTSNKKYFVLSLDGGGSRCIIQTVILQRLVQVFPDLLCKFDLFAGVSGGSINAAMLATGMKPELMAEVQKFMAPAVFGKGKRQATLELKGLSLRRAKYSADPLLILGEELFQGQSLAQCSNRLLIVSFVLDNEKDGQGRMWEPRVYHNVPMKKCDEADQLPFAMKKRELEDTPLWDHCLASSAAPTYFKSHKKHVDGGVVSNTASSAAIACLMSDGAEQPVRAADLHILNIGTGRITQYLEGEDDDHDWGIIQWGPKLPGLLFAAHDSFGHQLSSTILGSRYHRLDPFLDRPLGMDDSSSLPALIHLAQTINLEDTIEWIRHHIYAEMKPTTVGGGGISSSGGGLSTRTSTSKTTTTTAKSSFKLPHASAATIPAGVGLNSPGARTSQTWDNAWFDAHSAGQS